MSVSQNGWPVIEPSQIATKTHEWIIAPDTAPLRLLPGRNGFVLAHFALWYQREIEDISDPNPYDDHGWGYRQIGSTDTWSNHASATAIDLNAAAHPQGSRGTYTTEHTHLIVDILSTRYRDLIKWGGTFTTTPDEMHYEYKAGRSLIRELAVDLKDTRIGKRLHELNP